MKLWWCLLLWICWLSVIPGVAQVYRWTDENGSIHYTDNPETIPPHRRASSRQLSPPAADAPASVRPAPQAPPQPAVPTSEPGLASAETLSSQQQRVRALEQQITTTLQERQQLLDQLLGVREIRMNPAFGQQRRRVDDLGQALAAVERQLDALYAELGQLQATLQEPEPVSGAEAPGLEAPGEVVLDTQGRDQAYWRQRSAVLRARLQYAREQRQAILAQLAPETADERSAFGRRGQEVLQLVQALERTWQEMRASEAAWQALQQEASRAGAPAAWLQ